MSIELPSDWLTPKLHSYLCDRARSWVRRAEIDCHLGSDDWNGALAELTSTYGYKILTVGSNRHAAPAAVNLIDLIPATAFPKNMEPSLRGRLSRQGKLLCIVCGRTTGDPHPYVDGLKIRLHARSKRLPEDGRGQVSDNVEAVCCICQGSLERVQETNPSLAELKGQVGRADHAVQEALCAWLLERARL
jgi:hypothetical protein